MTLKELLKNIKIISTKGSMETNIFHLAQKVNDIKKGSLFFCYKGINGDGHNYIKKIEQRGAVALIVERFIDSTLPQILVKKTRNIMPEVCNNFFNNVTNKLKFIGVTGTNGKTTTTTIIYNILNNSDMKTALIGTNGIKYAKISKPQNLTTPDTIPFFYLLDKMQKKKIEYVVMEVSAHAISLNKIKGVKFEVGIFTNLTQDHLDYFKTMNNYARTKLKFLNKSYCKRVVLNIDDEYGNIFRKLINVPITTYGLNNPATCFAINIENNINNSTFVANIQDEIMNITCPLPCLFNVYNTLSAIITCKILGVNTTSIINSIKTLKQIDGRMNTYTLPNNITAIIDYAHTPDGMEKVLQNLSLIRNRGDITTVFGCGGNRDKTKREIMGNIASKYSNKIIITNDNPRNETPIDIANQILKGITIKNYEIELNREQAIKKAISNAKTGDIIAILGKGAEPYQEINNVKYKYNDYDVIKNFLLKNK